MTDEQLENMPKEEANRVLSIRDKYRWAELHSKTANLYVVINGRIEDVPPEGWWY